MYRVPLNFHKRLQRGEKPISYILVSTHMGYRAYAEKELKKVFDPLAYLADGTYTAGGSLTAGGTSAGVIDKSGRVISFGTFERSLQSMKDDVLGSYQSKTLQSMSIDLANTDDYFSKLTASEPFIGREIKYYIGFEDSPQSEHLKLFSGIITEIEELETFTIEAEEGEDGLSDTFYLGKSNRYTNPLNSSDLLPIVYGNNTDGSTGIWSLPCIDTVNFVYCFADHAVLSVADGNSISIYAAGVLIDPANYTFSASNNYESEGIISTVTFTTDQSNTVISARGKGKILTGTILMGNIIDIVNDLLTVENDWTSSLFETTAKATARETFEAKSYKAAGVITSDAVLWETITSMMGSFLGSAFINGSGELVLDIDINTIPFSPANIISKGDAYLTGATIKRDNIINQCPCNYGYNYVSSEFKHSTDDTVHADRSSQGIFGIREPNTPYQHYWCRDLTSIQKIQDLIVAKLKNPLHEIEITDTTLKRIGVDIGDHVAYSAAHLYGLDGIPLLNNYWKIISVKPDYAKNQIIFKGLQTPYYMTTACLADGSYTANDAIKAGGNRDMTVS
jgi:hypothetical protein